MAASRRQDQGFPVGKVTIGARGGHRQPKHLALQRRLVHFGHQRGQAAVVDSAQHRTAAMVAHEQVFAECLDDTGQAVGLQTQLARSMQPLKHIEFRTAPVTVGDEDECHDACGGFRAVAGVGAHGGVLS